MEPFSPPTTKSIAFAPDLPPLDDLCTPSDGLTLTSVLIMCSGHSMARQVYERSFNGHGAGSLVNPNINSDPEVATITRPLSRTLIDDKACWFVKRVLTSVFAPASWPTRRCTEMSHDPCAFRSIVYTRSPLGSSGFCFAVIKE